MTTTLATLPCIVCDTPALLTTAAGSLHPGCAVEAGLPLTQVPRRDAVALVLEAFPGSEIVPPHEAPLTRAERELHAAAIESVISWNRATPKEGS